jgi:hypothetical protein
MTNLRLLKLPTEATCSRCRKKKTERIEARFFLAIIHDIQVHSSHHVPAAAVTYTDLKLFYSRQTSCLPTFTALLRNHKWASRTARSKVISLLRSRLTSTLASYIIDVALSGTGTPLCFFLWWSRSAQRRLPVQSQFGCVHWTQRDRCLWICLSKSCLRPNLRWQAGNGQASVVNRVFFDPLSYRDGGVVRNARSGSTEGTTGCVGKIAVLEDVGKFSYHGRTMIIISCYLIQGTSLQIEGVIAVPTAAWPPDSLIGIYRHPAMGS